MKNKISIVIAVMMLFSIFGLAGCSSNPVKGIEYYLNFKLPTDMKVLYNYQPTGFIQGGRQPQYTVFQFQERPNEFLLERGFVIGTSPEEIPTDWLHGYKQYDVPTDLYPQWNEEFMWFRAHPVNLIYFETQKWLIAIIESN